MIDSDSEFTRGAKAAADIASSYNASTTHAHRLDDCILAKLNIGRRRPRPNMQRLQSVVELTANLARAHENTQAMAEVAQRYLQERDEARARLVQAERALETASINAAGGRR